MKASALLLVLASLGTAAAQSSAPAYPADWASAPKTPASTFINIKTSTQCRRVTVNGFKQGGIETFQGIPFAKPRE